MAKKNPHLQTRSEYGPYWGVYALPTTLPNAGTNSPANLLEPLEQGDVAYVSGGNAPGLYQCDNPGVTFPVPDGLAQWSPVGGGGGGGQDRFAPTFLVGNTAAGDSAVAYSSAGFSYYPDIGDGAQLEQALADAASGNRGRVYIRRGIYDLGLPGSPAVLPLVVAADVVVEGEGARTAVLANPNNQAVFDIRGSRASLSQLRINAPASPTSTGVFVAVVNTSLAPDAVTLSDLIIEVGGDPTPGTTLRRGINLVGATNARLENITVLVTAQVSNLDPVIGIGADTSTITARGVSITDPDQGISLNDSSLDLQQLVMTGFSTNAIVLNNTGTLHLQSAQLLSAANAPTTEGIVLAGSRHTLIDVNIANNDGGLPSSGVRFTGTQGSIRIDNCRITDGWFTGISLGASGADSVTNATITNCVIEAQSVGIFVPSTSTGVAIGKNQIVVTPPQAPSGPQPDSCILIDSGGVAQHTVEGNRLNITPGQIPVVYGIQNRSDSTTIRGNVIGAQTGIFIGNAAAPNPADGTRCTVVGNVMQGTVGIVVDAGVLNCVVNDNICTSNEITYVGAMIQCGGSHCTVNGNVTVVVNDAISPGIELTAASDASIAIGNMCQGTLAPASIVLDSGVGNLVPLGMNLGAL